MEKVFELLAFAMYGAMFIIAKTEEQRVRQVAIWEKSAYKTAGRWRLAQVCKETNKKSCLSLLTFSHIEFMQWRRLVFGLGKMFVNYFRDARAYCQAIPICAFRLMMCYTPPNPIVPYQVYSCARTFFKKDHHKNCIVIVKRNHCNISHIWITCVMMLWDRDPKEILTAVQHMPWRCIIMRCYWNCYRCRNSLFWLSIGRIVIAKNGSYTCLPYSSGNTYNSYHSIHHPFIIKDHVIVYAAIHMCICTTASFWASQNKYCKAEHE